MLSNTYTFISLGNLLRANLRVLSEKHLDQRSEGKKELASTIRSEGPLPIQQLSSMPEMRPLVEFMLGMGLH